jgi:hypothetical protein
MTTKRDAFACAGFLLALSALPAMADDWYDGPTERWYDANRHRRATHGAIYELETRIAFLEANPEIDDGYKAPIINGARADILRLRATLRPPQWRWASPCCYSRKPIHVR